MDGTAADTEIVAGAVLRVLSVDGRTVRRGTGHEVRTLTGHLHHQQAGQVLSDNLTRHQVLPLDGHEDQDNF